MPPTKPGPGLPVRSEERLLPAGLAGRLTIALAASWAVAGAAWVEVPMIPVPMTMQTWAVVLVGTLCGWRLGAAALALYLLQGALGLPVFAGGHAGTAVLTGPTGGYLAAFPVAAALCGFLAERGWRATLPRLLTSLLAGHALILAAGFVWLSGFVGAEKALHAGVLPFLAGMVLKSALAAASVRAVERLRPRRGT
ncbi:biotin transporter BioY [Rhodospirillum centenum]|uniref:Biotin transporter n=1 Tax=Rhodospirillum centenum (strain ATCC 51521 / SW) TaxID=414684 RepID=B6ITQ5_RHOCS|nr:biotin transporter BioY [Rhodospirillum centenum]ACI99356.1 BioY family protein [Rhodospirillum centenum SW]